MRILTLLMLAASASPAADIAAGWTHSVAVREGRVWTWGDNAFGQLGQPDAARTHRPRRVEGLSGVVAVSASWHTLALTSDGRVYAWGRNTYGQIGNGKYGLDADVARPVLIDGLTDIVAVAAGWDHSLALSRDGRVYAWGSRSHGQLGDGVRVTGDPLVKPSRVPDLADITAVSAGGHHSLALRADGTVLAWGSNWDGQLGNGTHGSETHSSAAQPVLSPEGDGVLDGITAITAGGAHSVAVGENGCVFAWGYNGTGQIPTGDRGGFWGSKGRRIVPRPVFALAADRDAPTTAMRAVAAGYEATYALSGEGGILAAGWSLYGEQGTGTHGGNRDVLFPVLTGRRITWQDPQPGRWRPALVYRYSDDAHADAGVTDLEQVDPFDGPTVVIGNGAGGELGSGRIDRNANWIEVKARMSYPMTAPAHVPLDIHLSALSFGVHAGDDDYAASVRLRWIDQDSGDYIDIPLDLAERAGFDVLPPLGDVQSLSAGAHHAIARDRNGVLWLWGHNGYGQIGDGSVSDRTVAVELPNFALDAPPTRPRVSPPPRPSAPPPEGRRVLDVREYGASGNGVTLDQAALQTVVDRCADAGGGTVWIPPGTYQTGTVYLRNGVRLHISEGATLLASGNREHFPERCMIRASGVHDIAITGKGVIDGRGHLTGARNWRHNCILMEDCDRVRVEDVSTIDAGAWTQHYIRCRNLTIRNAYVRSLRPGRNNDGIDLSGCEDVLIQGCTVISDDDAIVIKSQSADRVNRNIRVIGNTCHTYRGAFKMGTETRGVFENITCRDLTCHGSKALELYSVDGSQTNGIVIENVRAHNALVALNVRLGARLRPYYFAKGVTPEVGWLRNIRIRGVTAEVASRAWRELLLQHDIPGAEWATARPEGPYDSCISGLPGHAVEDVVIEDVTLRVPGGVTEPPAPDAVPERPDAYPHAGMFGRLPAHGLFIRHARDITIRRFMVRTDQPDARPPISDLDVTGLVIE